MTKMVGKFTGSSYSRYKRPRDRSSGIELHNRYSTPPYTHVYGSDFGIKTRKIGEKKEMKKYKER